MSSTNWWKMPRRTIAVTLHEGASGLALQLVISPKSLLNQTRKKTLRRQRIWQNQSLKSTCSKPKLIQGMERQDTTKQGEY